MTPALQARRGMQSAGSSTCVRRQDAHRARPGRRLAWPPPGTRTRRARALAHGRSTPPQPSSGQRSSPRASARSAAQAYTTKITITHLGHPASLAARAQDPGTQDDPVTNCPVIQRVEADLILDRIDQLPELSPQLGGLSP